jgi:hypothetical protein
MLVPVTLKEGGSLRIPSQHRARPSLSRTDKTEIHWYIGGVLFASLTRLGGLHIDYITGAADDSDDSDRCINFTHIATPLSSQIAEWERA